MNNEISDEDKKAIEAMVSAAVDSAAAVGDRGLRVVAGTDYGQAEAITAADHRSASAGARKPLLRRQRFASIRPRLRR